MLWVCNLALALQFGFLAHVLCHSYKLGQYFFLTRAQAQHSCELVQPFQGQKGRCWTLKGYQTKRSVGGNLSLQTSFTKSLARVMARKLSPRHDSKTLDFAEASLRSPTKWNPWVKIPAARYASMKSSLRHEPLQDHRRPSATVVASQGVLSMDIRGLSLAHNIQNKKAICCGDVARRNSPRDRATLCVADMLLEELLEPLGRNQRCWDWGFQVRKDQPWDLQLKCLKRQHKTKPVGSNCTNVEHVRRFRSKHSIIP